MLLVFTHVYLHLWRENTFAQVLHCAANQMLFPPRIFHHMCVSCTGKQSGERQWTQERERVNDTSEDKSVTRSDVNTLSSR